ncbi:MAG: HlyD family efflux transporter periplasmic adaptor subunit [Gammaproteobacteria bacterium]|jgi:HlyD family secretion protein|nr:HlyD family efflux transporter periplasmic adaptor subunit [Gammaproteobacteria bacterium]MDH3862499.1 HlyD family efflux transporter periplasmic adaptor subunit [Gammaproteobacteria bacterium]MDH3904627.1 HlyD family efflux transporter periplasmic adaptor subunit [Gammaproteobacteria bacterium]NCF58548.1 HlyD family efflux transporter periplasmic adaptor subunit [Gammaproteobacteria bacterium]
MRPRNLFVAGLAAMSLAACDNPDNLNVVVGELASDRIELIAEVNEPILEILVAEGEPVTAGQLILRQDDTRASARLREAEAAVGQAQARLDELVRGPRQEQIAQARANLAGANRDIEFRRTEFLRAKDLLKKELASPQTRDRAKAELDAAEANVELRRAQLQELLAGTTVEELAQAEQSLLQAQARRDSATVDVERHRLVAPVNGVFDSRLFEPGERPPAGQPVAVMLGGSQPYARIYVPERLRARVRPGTDARVAIDGTGAPLAGRVRWVAHEAAFTPYFALTERDRGRLTYLAKVDIEEQQERLPDGVPVEVKLLLPDGGP